MTVTIQLINQECSPISQFFLVVGFKAHVTSLNPMLHVNYAKKQTLVTNTQKCAWAVILFNIQQRHLWLINEQRTWTRVHWLRARAGGARAGGGAWDDKVKSVRRRWLLAEEAAESGSLQPPCWRPEQPTIGFKMSRSLCLWSLPFERGTFILFFPSVPQLTSFAELTSLLIYWMDRYDYFFFLFIRDYFLITWSWYFVLIGHWWAHYEHCFFPSSFG